MAIIGFLFLIVVLIYFTVSYFVVFLNVMGAYNIGGVPNTWKARIATLLAGAALMWVWQEVLLVSPFEVIIK